MSELIVDKVTAKIIQSDTYNIANTALNVGNNTQSVSTSTGSITANGGLGILGNAYIAGNGNIGGSATISGGATISGALTISNNTQSASTISGSITTNGGIGILKDANIGGNTTISGFLDINSALASSSTSTGSITTNGGIGIQGDANIGGALNVSSDLASTTTDTGSITTKGGIGILGSANIGGTLTVGNFTTGNVSPRSVLHRGLPSVVGRIVSIYIGEGKNTAYSSTPLDAGVWEVHVSLHENNSPDEDPHAEYHTVVTVPANNYLTWKLTHVKSTTIAATGFQYRYQTDATSVVNTNTSPAWTSIPMLEVELAASNLGSGSVGNGALMGMVGSTAQIINSVTNFVTGYAKRIA